MSYTAHNAWYTFSCPLYTYVIALHYFWYCVFANNHHTKFKAFSFSIMCLLAVIFDRDYFNLFNWWLMLSVTNALRLIVSIFYLILFLNLYIYNVLHPYLALMYFCNTTAGTTRYTHYWAHLRWAMFVCKVFIDSCVAVIFYTLISFTLTYI